jgi:hypothetical protein
MNRSLEVRLPLIIRVLLASCGPKPSKKRGAAF